VVDVACGRGRHTRLFLDLGHEVLAIDRDVSGIADLTGDPRWAEGAEDRPHQHRLRVVRADLEDGFDLGQLGARFAGVVVTNYLYRPILADLVSLVDAGGLLIYETFAVGNERYGRPHNPDFLLRPGELLDATRGTLRVLAYEDLVVDDPRPAAVQRIAAQRAGTR
jgi:SAM-dependent methyltransferase